MDELDKACENTQICLDANIKKFVSQATKDKINHLQRCYDCDMPIDPRRLAVHPQAIRCTDCQEDHETFHNRQKILANTRGVIQNMS